MGKSAQLGFVCTGSVALLLWAMGCGGAGATPAAPGDVDAAPPVEVSTDQPAPAESSTAEPVSAVPRAAASTEEPAPEPTPGARAASDALTTPPYDVPERTTEELSAEITRACERAKQENEPVLLEFGASWCKDCRRLGTLASVEPLASELASWQRVEVNITDPEPHEALLQTFGVRAIAHWEALVPTQCSAPVGRWKRIGSRSVEPKRADAETAEQLSRWLASARKRGASR